MCVQLNELMAGVNFVAFECIDREYYRRLLFLWFQERISQIEIYTPEDQWLAALRLITRGRRHYQLEVYRMEQVAPCPAATIGPLTLGRLEQGITLYPATTAEIERNQRDHDRNASPEWVRVGLLFDQTHHVVAWGDLDRAGDLCHLVEKFNQFAKYTNQAFNHRFLRVP